MIQNNTETINDNRNRILNDLIIQSACNEYKESISSKKLDREFYEDIKSFATILSKLPEPQRKYIIDALSKSVEFYISRKVEKEINSSFNKVMKF